MSEDHFQYWYRRSYIFVVTYPIAFSAIVFGIDSFLICLVSGLIGGYIEGLVYAKTKIFLDGGEWTYKDCFFSLLLSVLGIIFFPIVYILNLETTEIPWLLLITAIAGYIVALLLRVYNLMKVKTYHE